jgi:drug/metabolite transporter (DMT)-like permease
MRRGISRTLLAVLRRGDRGERSANVNMNRIIGVVILAVGLTLVGFAYHASEAPIDQISNTLTGRYSNETMWYFIAGIAALVGGGLLAAFGNRK